MNKFIEGYKEELLENLSQLVSIPSIFDGSDPEHPYGAHCTEALEFMLELGRQKGFKTCNLDNHVGYIEYGDGEDYVAILTHLDVVPVGNGWTKEPFGGEIVDGRIYGRGTIDDKGPAIVSFYALCALKDEGFVPKHRIRLIMGLNEESGSKCIKHYLKTESQPVAGFTPDAEFPVTFAEKGIMGLNVTKDFSPSLRDGGFKIVSVTGGIAGNMVPDACRAEIVGHQEIGHIVEAFNGTYGKCIAMTKEGEKVVLDAKGKAAHASTPEKGRNAIGLMMKCLDCLDLEIGDAANFVRGCSRRFGMESDGESIGLKCADEISGELTLNVGIVDLSPEKAALTVNIRYPVTLQMTETLTETFQEVVTFEGWQVEVKSHSKPLHIQRDSPLIQKLMKIYCDHTGDTAAVPLAIGGGTYARSMNNIVAFGILMPHMPDTMHQADESIGTEELYTITDIFVDAIRVLSV